MRNRSEILKIFGILSVVIILGIGIGWLGSRNTTTPSQANADEKSQPLSSQTTDADNNSLPAKSFVPALVEAKPVTGELAQSLGEAVQNGEDQISEILGADGEVAEKSRGLLKLFPKLSETEQVEAARHLVNLISDEEYAPLGQILTNSLTTSEVSEILLDDLLNRANSIKVPLILAVARDSHHPQAANAQTLMERLLGEDYAMNRSQWETLAKVWLEENPD